MSGRERMQVMVFEAVRNDPQAAVDAVWTRLGVPSVSLRDVERPSGSSSRASWTPPEGLLASLEVVYRPQVRRLVEDWGLDVSTWSTQP